MKSNRALQYIKASLGFFYNRGISGSFWKDHGRISYDTNAKRYLEIDRELPFSQEAAAHQTNSPSPTLTFLSNALIQATFLMILRKDWLQQKERDFVEHVSDRHDTLFSQIRNAIEGSSSRERVSLSSAIQEAYHAYLPHEPKDSTPHNLELAFATIKKQEILLKFAAELARQINSRIIKGELIEQPSFTLLNQQSTWLKKTMKSVRILLPIPHARGKFFAKVEALLDEIDKDFDKFPDIEEHEMPQSLLSE